ncbi:MAG: trypsin-like peptidase domain-containing protein [Anaerolineae bacterium]|nr:trypsin-like peptidase domain-containing protein [Anaerolineae bacterium]MDW8101844.1 trypsin-like peptidase domain-containing protein [Anaerolineae bacterium]
MSRKWLIIGLVTALLSGACKMELDLLKIPRIWEATPTPQPKTVKVTPVPTPTPAALTSKEVVVTGEVLDEEEEALLVSIYERVNPAVVSIRVVKKGLIRLPFSHPEIPSEGRGSGFVWDERGYIVTNNHVVSDAEEIEVIFYNGDAARARVVGTDPHSDLAVLKVDELTEGAHPAELGDSSQVKVGQRAIAIGNPFGLAGTMTVGIISAVGRTLRPAAIPFTIPEVIQTDATINPGNSGGPLLNSSGQVIGINTAIESPVGINAGIGFAVPINLAKKIVPVLIEKGSYDYPWLGIEGTTVTKALAREFDLPVDYGALVIRTIKDGPAHKAGIKGGTKKVQFMGGEITVGGDIITGVDGQEIRRFDDLLTYLIYNTSVGQEITLKVIRDGEEVKVRVVLGKRPQALEEEQ